MQDTFTQNNSLGPSDVVARCTIIGVKTHEAGIRFDSSISSIQTSTRSF